MDADTFYVWYNLQSLSQFVCRHPWLQLATLGVKYYWLNWQWAVTRTKTKTDIQRAFQSRIAACSIVFRELNMFPKYLQTYYGIFML